MSSEFEIIEGLKKNTKNYVHDGYIYTKNNSDALKTRLRCRDWKDGCKGTAYIENGKFFVNRKCLHDRAEQAINKQKIEAKMKDMAGKTCAPLRQIYDENLDTSTSSAVSPFSKISSTLSKRRRIVLPKLPKTINEFDKALKTDEGNVNDKSFYRGFVTAGQEFALIFFLDTDSGVIKKIQHGHIDGTFKVVPKPFFQLVTFHVVVMDTVIPFFYALMTSKSRALYDALFLRLRNSYPCLKFEKCTTDFEPALFTSIKFNFECQMQGCFFHYKKALWRKWVKLGLSRNWESISVQWLKLLMCLPFLPGDSIENAFFDLAPNKFFGQDVEPEQSEFYQYIEQYWFNKIPRELLSVHGCVRRTNSEVECYHWGLLRKIHFRHPNFWVFVRKLKEIAYSYSVEMKQANDGQDTRRKRCKLSITIDRTIRANEEKLQEGRISTMDFLKKMTHVNQSSINKLKLKDNYEESDDEKDVDDENNDQIDENNALNCSETESEENFGLCCGCEEKEISYLLRPCGHMVCEICFRNRCCKCCGVFIADYDKFQ